MDKQCSLCGSRADFLCRQRVLGKYDVAYFHCGRCDLIQTEEPYWLDEAYSSTMSALDTGAMARNLFCASLVPVFCRLLGVKGKHPCLDYGGGHGVLTRLLRDRGYDYSWHDKYGPNLFARGFAGDPTSRYDLVTAFEVFEHLAATRDELTRLFQPRHKFLLVSTLLHAGHQPGWWYYMPESGQHVSFYSRRTIEHVAGLFGYRALCGTAHVLFIRGDVRLGAFRQALARAALRWYRFAAAVGGVLLPLDLLTRSLTLRDHAAMRQKTLGPAAPR
jgi:hypothetical protein